MKLGILTYSLSSGGAERVVSYLLPYFMDLKIEVHLILMNSEINFEIPEDMAIHYLGNSESEENGLLKLMKVPFLAYKYAQLCKKLKLTHSFSLLSRPNYINILSKYFGTHNYKIIISERAHPSLQYGYHDFKSIVNKFLIRNLYSKSEMVICNSNGNANDLIKNFGLSYEKTSVIHNPIDLQKIDNILPLENFFDRNIFNLISVGRLDQGKNFKLLINSVRDIPNVRLYILGEGSEKQELEKMIASKNLEDKVFLLGFDSNPFKYLKSADLFIFGSNHEGFPNVLLEAMACHLPILSTNCPSGPDEILQLTDPSTNELMFTDYGILVPVDNENLMIKGIKYFLNCPNYLNNCKNNSKERVKHFGRDEILKNYYKCIFKI